LAFTLINTPVSLVLYNRLKEQLRLGSVNTVISYVDYLANSWLIFLLTVNDFSVKRQQIAPKEAYCIDKGGWRTMCASVFAQLRQAVGDLVFLALRRFTRDLLYLLRQVAVK
jgi:uncharacterized protein